MPSDCQCSACNCTTKIVRERIGDKEAIAMIKKLEKEVEELRRENEGLRVSSSRNKTSKRKIIKALQNKLDKLLHETEND